MKRVLFLVNHDVVIYNFRKEMVECLINEGYEVVISSPYGERIDFLIEMGCKYVEVKLDRHGMNPLKEIQLLVYYKELISTIKPMMIFSFTIKPNIYGAMAAAMCKIPIVTNITGLGTAVEGTEFKAKVLTVLYKVAFRKVQTVFLQNRENMQFFIDNRIAVNRLKLLPGSGVNLQEFTYQKPSDTGPGKERFLFVGRVMKDKGIVELLEAARMVKANYPEIEFEIVGFLDGDYEEMLNQAQEDGVIQYRGQQSDVKIFYKNCDAVILPSYHEGMANVLLEAAASGRPIIASNIPGCRETFDEGITGLGFEPRNTKSLYNAIIRFLQLPMETRKLMGQRGREKVEREFDRNIIVNQYMKELKRR